MSGRLSIVATPIGNLEDITLRAIRVLKEADVIFCEDTRVTGKLLKKYEIETPLKRCDAHKEAVATKQVIEFLEEGKCVAYVTDAGTPGVSDPGARIVRAVRDELPDAVIEAIPGASAITAALSIAGIVDTEFTFYGFAPHKKGRQTFFEHIATAPYTAVFYESPHRILKTLEALREHMPDCSVVLARELTKMHEEVLRGTPEELLMRLEEDANHQRGEFVVLIEGSGVARYTRE